MKDHDYTDPVLEEIWAIRDRHAAEADYDLEKLWRIYREYQKQFGDELIRTTANKEADRPAA